MADKKVKYSDREVTIRDDVLPRHTVDLIIEARFANGVGYFSFAASVEDEGCEPEGRPVARLAFNARGVKALRDVCDQMLGMVPQKPN